MEISPGRLSAANRLAARRKRLWPLASLQLPPHLSSFLSWAKFDCAAKTLLGNSLSSYLKVSEANLGLTCRKLSRQARVYWAHFLPTPNDRSSALCN